jgi:hypothetical protein
LRHVAFLPVSVRGLGVHRRADDECGPRNELAGFAQGDRRFFLLHRRAPLPGLSALSGLPCRLLALGIVGPLGHSAPDMHFVLPAIARIDNFARRQAQLQMSAIITKNRMFEKPLPCVTGSEKLQ